MASTMPTMHKQAREDEAEAARVAGDLLASQRRAETRLQPSPTRVILIAAGGNERYAPQRREVVHVQLHAQSRNRQAVARPTRVAVNCPTTSARIGRSLSAEML